MNGFNEFSLQLLHRGSYIGYKSVIKTIDKNLLEKYLDGCVRNKRRANDIHISFKFLKTPDSSTETQPLLEIAGNENTQSLIPYPVLISFAKVKWLRMNLLVYLNLLIWFFMITFLVGFIVMFFQNTAYNQVQELSENRSWEIKDEDSSLYFVAKIVDGVIRSAMEFYDFFFFIPPLDTWGKDLGNMKIFYDSYSMIANSSFFDERCEVFRMMVNETSLDNGCLRDARFGNELLQGAFLNCIELVLSQQKRFY